MIRRKESYNAMDTLAKSIATVIMWAGMLGVIFLAIPNMGGLAVLLALVLMIPLLAIMAFMWVVNSPFAYNHSQRGKQQEENQEKRKRDMLDSVLRELSDEQLAALKYRLSEPDFEERLEYMIGDDGELIQR